MDQFHTFWPRYMIIIFTDVYRAPHFCVVKTGVMFIICRGVVVLMARSQLFRLIPFNVDRDVILPRA